MIKNVKAVLIAMISVFYMHADYTYKLFEKESIEEVLPFIVANRIEAFREYPYLYEGNWDEEASLIRQLSTMRDSAVVVAFFHDQPVGFLSGVSFQAYDDHFVGSVEKFQQAGFDAQAFYYFPEMIIVSEHRGKGLSKKLFTILKENAKKMGYTQGCFVTESHENHHLKPVDYRGLDTLWSDMGCQKTDITLNFSWMTLQNNNEQSMQEHILTYWIKDFSKPDLRKNDFYPA